jgi:polyhydroxybutyrate depolymerase
VDGVARTYRAYVPQGLAKGAPLVVVMHGSGENGAEIRIETGRGFDRTADTQLWRIRDRRTFASPCPTR